MSKVPRSFLPKRFIHHQLYIPRLCTTPDHRLNARMSRDELSEYTHIWPWVDLALMSGFNDRSEDERSVEVEHEEFSGWMGETIGWEE